MHTAPAQAVPPPLPVPYQSGELQAAQAAVVQAVEVRPRLLLLAAALSFMTDHSPSRLLQESGFGRSYQQGHPQLVSESSAISQKVLSHAHVERQHQFIKAGFVSNEFSNATIENAAVRAQHAVIRSAEMLGPAATSSEIIHLASIDPTMLPQPAPPPNTIVYPPQQPNFHPADPNNNAFGGGGGPR